MSAQALSVYGANHGEHREVYHNALTERNWRVTDKKTFADFPAMALIAKEEQTRERVNR